jgi:fructose-bisphosphate aldolase, class II
MPLPTADEYGAMIDDAAAGGYAIPAVNVTSTLTLNAALRGFAEARSPGIVQATVGGAGYFSGPAEDALTGARALALAGHELIARCPVPVALHTDHCPPDRVEDFLVPLIAASRERADRGERPLFNSHMFDGSTLPLEDNLTRSAALLEACRQAGTVLEIEVGVVGGVEDGIGAEDVDRERLYTSTADLLRVAEALGTGERGRYLLAATFGNVHGVYAPGNVMLRPAVLHDGQVALAERRPGARFQYVFHGSSGSEPDDIRAAIANGVVKINLDTDAQYAFTRAVADHLFTNYDGVLRVDGDVGRKAAYDPRSWGRNAEAALARRVAEASELFGSAGRSLLS